MDGSYLNLEVELPSGKFAKLLDDNKKYYANRLILTAVIDVTA